MTDKPLYIGSIEKSGIVETDDGEKIQIITDQGDFLLDARNESQINGLQIVLEMYQS